MAKTGFEKFIEGHEMETHVTPVMNTREKEDTLPKPSEHETTTANDITITDKPNNSKRQYTVSPKLKNEKSATIRLSIDIDIELREILDSLKYKVGCNSVKGVLIQSLKLLLKKYGIEYDFKV